MDTNALKSNRRSFISGSDARIIMGQDEAALIQLCEKARRGRTEDFSQALIVQLGLATEKLNRHWYETQSGQIVIDAQKHVKHPIHKWMGATLDGRIKATGDVFEANFMLLWSFSEEAAYAKHMAQL